MGSFVGSFFIDPMLSFLSLLLGQISSLDPCLLLKMQMVSNFVRISRVP